MSTSGPFETVNFCEHTCIWYVYNLTRPFRFQPYSCLQKNVRYYADRHVTTNLFLS